MGKFVDSVIALRILKLLVTPFKDTEAFKLGIIDEKGKELKKMRDLRSVQERDAYTLLHRLVYRLKKIIEKVPIENKKLVSFAAAYALIKEDYEAGRESTDLEVKFINKMRDDLTEEISLIESALDTTKLYTFKQFSEEMGAGAVGGVAANNAASTPGVGGLPPDEPPVSKKKQKEYQKLNTMFRRDKWK
jgi:hypothetical protein